MHGAHAERSSVTGDLGQMNCCDLGVALPHTQLRAWVFF